jgi:serine protease AprX
VARRKSAFLMVAGLSVTLTLILSVFVPLPAGSAASDARLEKAAGAALSEELNIPLRSLRLVSAAVGRWPLTGKTVPVLKFRDQRNGDIHEILLDRGRPVDPEDLDAAEAHAFFERFGRLDPQLHRHMEGLADGDEVRVLLWLKEPPYQRPARHAPHSEPSNAEIERAAAAADADRAAFVARVNGPVLEKLAEFDRSASADAFAPLVAATLTAAEVRRAGEWSEVDRIYLDGVNEGHLDKARPSIRAELVHNLGFTGSTADNLVFIGQIEGPGGKVASHTNLQSIVRDDTYVCAAAADHATKVAGVIKSGHATWKGIAPTAVLRAAGSCQGYNAELTNRSTEAANWGARALNLSWGNDDSAAPGVLEKFYDGMVVNRYRSIVVAAGNEASPCPPNHGRITNPGMAYNAITVGAFNDRNTADWSTDNMYACSSYVDPLSTYGDREEPDVVAPGVEIITTGTSNNFVVDGGTSMAAPMVTGAAALLMQRDPSLKEWPAGLRAIMLATAYNNIDSGQRLSDKDGAGGIDVRRAYDAAFGVNNSGWDGVDLYECSDAANFSRTVSLKAGRRTRIAVAWDNDPAWTSYSSRPSADFDMHILAPGGTPVASSTSKDNTYEIVDFTPQIEGTYTMQFARSRCNYAPWVVAWAWSNAIGPN